MFIHIFSDTVVLRQEAPYKVPNLVHYIWYNKKTIPLQFHHMISILSAHKNIQPDVIYFHTDVPPFGPYWEKVKRLPNLKINHRKPPQTVLGERIKKPLYYTSHSNVDRLLVLKEYGGIYLDMDVMVIRSFDELRKHSCTIGLESDYKACGSAVICAKDSFFLTMWLNSYLDDYRIDVWAYNSGKVPFNLAKRYPHLVNVERTKLNRPNFNELRLIWGPETFDWKKNYAIHTWIRLYKSRSTFYTGSDPSPQNIKRLNNTYGQIARSIYFGNEELICD